MFEREHKDSADGHVGPCEKAQVERTEVRESEGSTELIQLGFREVLKCWVWAKWAEPGCWPLFGSSGFEGWALGPIRG